MTNPESPSSVVLISVLMPVYNGESFLAEAIDSILSQTMGDFELLIINDGSTDRSREIISSYRDSRIRLEDNSHNLGLIATLNRGLDLAQGRYIARMDCDDIALPKRLEKQVAFMEANPDIGLCGTWYERFEGGDQLLFHPPTDDRSIRFVLTYENAFGHNTIMMRRDIIQRLGLKYDPAFKYAEDYEFWVRCSRHMKMANLPEALVRYRFHPGNTSSVFQEEQKLTADRVRELQLDNIRLHPSAKELAIHQQLMHFRFNGTLEDLELARLWLAKLCARMHEEFGLSTTAIWRRFSRYWYGACGVRADAGISVWWRFISSPAGRYAGVGLLAKLLLRCVFRKPIPVYSNPGVATP